MPGSESNNPMPIDWKSFEQFFGGKVPFLPSGKSLDLSWVENFVQEVMKQAVPRATGPGNPKVELSADTFETHKFVIARIRMPEKIRAKNMRVFVGTNHIKLDGLPDNKTQTIKLPATVIPKASSAVYKDGVLQIQMRKQLAEEKFRELVVRYT